MTGNKALFALTIFSLILSISSVASAQEPEGLHPFVSNGSVPGRVEDGGLNSTFLVVIPLGENPSRDALHTLMNNSLVNWMNFFHPISEVPQGTLVHIKIIVKRGMFITYVFSITHTTTNGDTWEELLSTGVDGFFENLVTNADGLYLEGEYAYVDDPTAMDPTGLLFPPNATIVINGDGSNGNYCGPGTPYDCVFLLAPPGGSGSMDTIDDTFGGDGNGP